VARLIQDIPADWLRGRVYLPAEDLGTSGSPRPIRVAPDLARGRSAGPLRVAGSRALFERARPLVDLAGPDLAVELALTWHGGMRILDKIASVGERLFATARSSAARQGDRAGALVAWRGETLPPGRCTCCSGWPLAPTLTRRADRADAQAAAPMRSTRSASCRLTGDVCRHTGMPISARRRDSHHRRP